jgi:mannose-6-phosphate isomerase-like protein (cupin superfamily)
MDTKMDFGTGENGEMVQSVVEPCTKELVEQSLLVIEEGNQIGGTKETVWGSDKELVMTPYFMAKLLTVDPGKTLSQQRHDFKDEAYILEKGRAEVLLGLEEALIYRLATKYSVLFLPKGTVHRLRNAGDEPLVIWEVSTPYGTDTVRLYDPNRRGNVTPNAYRDQIAEVMGTGR